MKGEVEVTFKCEGCGTTLLVSKHHRPETAAVDIHDTVTIDDITCPNCAKLHYGPLTEEMVAEALWRRCGRTTLTYRHGRRAGTIRFWMRTSTARPASCFGLSRQSITSRSRTALALYSIS